MMPREGRIPISELAARLNDQAEAFARHYLTGGRKDGRHWRCSNAWGGSGGSFYLNLTGQHKGKWRDESEDSSGDCLDILAAQFGKERSAQEAMAFLGIGEDKPLPKREAPPPEAEVSWQDQPSRKRAKELWDKAQAIAPDSPGSLYPDARMGRSLEAYPPSMRFLKGAWYSKDENKPAILFRVDDLSGEFRGIQRVFLEKSLDARVKAEDAKRSLGPVREGAIRFKDPEPGGVLMVTEGPEKGLALSLMVGWQGGVWATPGAGMMASQALPEGLAGLLIMADHDAPDKKGKRVGQERAQALANRALSMGMWVKIVVPPVEGKDWDDYLAETDDAGNFTGWIIEQISAAHTLEAAPAEQQPSAEVIPFPLGDPRDEPPPPAPDEGKKRRGKGGYEFLQKVQPDFVYIKPQERFFQLSTEMEYSISALNNAYRAEYFSGENGGKIGRDLIADAETVKVDAITYWPGAARVVKEGPRLCLNIWSASAVEPIPGDPKPFLDHIELLCDGDDTFAKEFLSWMANLIQYPGRKSNKSPLIIGNSGVGKSTMRMILSGLLGRTNVPEVAPHDLIAGNFNDMLLRAQVVVMDEMRSQEKWQLVEILKPLMTNDTIRIKQKFKDSFEITNRINWLFISNHMNAAGLNDDDRRFFVAKTGSDPGAEYAVLFRGWLDRDGIGIIKHFLLGYDLAEWSPYDRAPPTRAKEQVIDINLTEVEATLNEMLENRHWPFVGDLVTLSAIKQAILEQDPKAKVRRPDIINWLHSKRAVQIKARPRVTFNGKKDRPYLWALDRQDYWKETGEDLAGAAWQRVLDQKGRAMPDDDEMPFEGWSR